MQRLLTRHVKIMDLVLDGHSTKSIADQLGMTPVGVGLIINAPLFQHELARRRGDMEAKDDDLRAERIRTAGNTIAELAPLASRKLGELMYSDEEETQLKAIRTILDHAFDAKRPSLQVATQVVITSDQSKAIFDAAREAEV